jgi:glycosyltransferase involved in cell wall biosynthesis
MPILEAQATGRVVVTSNISSMPEVAGEGAQQVDPNDVESICTGILKVIHDSDFRNNLIQKGFINIRRFESNHVAGKYLELYRALDALRKEALLK